MSKNVEVKKKCDKCGKPIPWGYSNWTKTSFISGRIDLEMPSGALDKYKRKTNEKYLNYLEVDEEDTTGQRLVLQYGGGSNYDLCYSCRDLLVETLAKFFNTKI